MTNVSVSGCANTTVSGSSEGSNTLRFAAVDSSGNLNDTESASYTFSSGGEAPVREEALISNGFANATLDISSLSDPSRLDLRLGSQVQTRSFTVSLGVEYVAIYANVTSGGNPVSGRNLVFEIS